MKQLNDVNYLGLDIAKCLDGRFGENCTYLGTFPTKTNTYAIFHSPNPDTSKGHKPYFGLTTNQIQMYINGWTKEQIKEMSKISVLECLKCGDIVYSLARHDYRSCKCKACAIDGGYDYNRFVANPSDCKIYVYDYIEKTFNE